MTFPPVAAPVPFMKGARAVFFAHSENFCKARS
jgi:hypothetical protein